MSDDLKPCPFCGGYAVSSCEDREGNHVFWSCEVFCVDCNASISRYCGPNSDGNENDADAEVREEWNRRVDPLEAEALAEKAERDVLREALKWYANLPKSWTLVTENGMTCGNLELLGETARIALTRAEETQMTRKKALEEIIVKVKAGDLEGARHFSKAFGLQPDNRHLMAWSAYNGSTDAAKELHEAVLPGWWWKVIHPDPSYAQVGMQGIGDYSAETKDPARAWLIAILRALHAQETDS